jgi:isoaspartyl peptidase/L-asparaginase-like protein (Ntn-hydrolase superfamily)
VAAGFDVLARGGSALDAVQAAVVVLEDDATFNAGHGAALTDEGGVELDAAIMRGTDRAAGAVAALRGIRHPILAARAVLEEGRHVLLAGEAGAAWARATGVPEASEGWLATPARKRDASQGTVGAVARDARGGLAAATSTGGMTGQRPGRVGDSPLVGAGTWADDETAAVSCTGTGEAIIRAALAHEVDALIRHGGRTVAQAGAEAVAALARYGGDGGLVAVARQGDVAAPFSSRAMARAWRVGDGAVVTAVD